MAQFFISYSRKDLTEAEKIIGALKSAELEPWVDWEDIPKGEDFTEEIRSGIEKSEVVIFLLSPDSVQSEWCRTEISYAVQHNKRLLPVVIRDTAKGLIHPALAKLNWIYCRPERGEFKQALEEISKTIRTDFEWVKFHTSLQVKALEWDRRKDPKDTSALLRGNKLREADKQLILNSHKEPYATELQKLFLATSKKAEKRFFTSVSIGVMLLVILTAAIGWIFYTQEPPLAGQWLLIPAGDFVMGMDQVEADFSYEMCLKGAFDKSGCLEPDFLLKRSGRQIEATLGAFSIMDNEVTNAQFQQCIDAGKCPAPKDWAYAKQAINHPATKLDWYQATEYCQWLGGRLPTEGEWEKAARGPKGNYFPWGNDWETQQANLEKSGVSTLASIATYADKDLSYYGVKNMAGNVQEWTTSEFDYLADHQKFLNKTPTAVADGSNWPVTIRGGYWGNVRNLGLGSYRQSDGATTQREEIGFRCACPEGQQCNSPWSKWWIIKSVLRYVLWAGE